MPHDRQLLLTGAKRNAVLELWEVQRYGMDSYGDADYVSVYGLPPAEWYARGIRLLGRTAVECTRDVLGGAMAEDVAAIAASAPRVDEARVVDLFAGSGNTLYWLLRRLPGSRGLGFERDGGVFELTRRNLAALTLDIDIVNCDFSAGLTGVAAVNDQLLVVFIAPPWGDALDPSSGLDLRRTEPPVADIVDLLLQRFPTNRILFAIQVYEVVDPDSLAELQRRFDWSQLRIYALNAPGQNHGLLLGTGHWHP
jgi:16S rRNA G966 N2-methylase RsmD